MTPWLSYGQAVYICLVYSKEIWIIMNLKYYKFKTEDIIANLFRYKI